MLTRPRPRFGAALCLASAALLLAGCAVEGPTTPTSVPVTPTYHPATPAPVSDADVEAAIASYLAYVEAGNAVDLADPSSVDAALAFTSGAQREFEEDFYANLSRQGWRIAGSSAATRIVPSAAQPASDPNVVMLDICVNNEEIDFIDAEGEHRIPPGLQAHQTVRATMTRAADVSPTHDGPEWLVTDTSPIETDQPCSGGGA